MESLAHLERCKSLTSTLSEVFIEQFVLKWWGFYIVPNCCFLSSVDQTDVLVTSEEAVPVAGELFATQSGQTEEPSSRTVVLVTPAPMAPSVRRTALPSVRRISTAVTYGLDRLESEGTADPKAKKRAVSCGVARLP